MIRLALALFISMAALCGDQVSAHDKWADGSPVPDWVKRFCCGPEDVHHYRADEVKVTPDGFVLPDYPNVIPMDHALRSEDGDYWAFFTKDDKNVYSTIYCFFAPPGST